jgi:hypothetical protein
MIHIYRSTACLHKLHKECRRNCKFCDTPCDCPCHRVEQKPQEPIGGVAFAMTDLLTENERLRAENERLRQQVNSDFDYTAGGRILAMIAKKTVVVARPFKGKDGQDHKPGDRIEVDPEYGVELKRQGNIRDDAEVDNTLPTPPKAEPK